MPFSYLILLQNDDETQKIRLVLNPAGKSRVTGNSLQRAILNHLHLSDCDGDAVSIEIYDGGKNLFVPLSSFADIQSSLRNRLRCTLIRTVTVAHPRLQLMGRYFPYDTTMIINRHQIQVQEHPNGSLGTGLTVWDGAILLTKFLEQEPAVVKDKSVLEFGSGTGLVGIAACILGATRVIMTDLPYALPLMQANVDCNRVQDRVECRSCDWYQSPEFGVERWAADVVLLADCVWVQELVPPLLATLKQFVSQHNPIVILSYQRRGKGAHDLFWDGMNQLFSSIVEMDVTSVGLSKPDVLHIYTCRN
jgi:Lysine methyltransferase